MSHEPDRYRRERPQGTALPEAFGGALRQRRARHRSGDAGPRSGAVRKPGRDDQPRGTRPAQEERGQSKQPDLGRSAERLRGAMMTWRCVSWIFLILAAGCGRDTVTPPQPEDKAAGSPKVKDKS